MPLSTSSEPTRPAGSACKSPVAGKRWDVNIIVQGGGRGGVGGGYLIVEILFSFLGPAWVEIDSLVHVDLTTHPTPPSSLSLSLSPVRLRADSLTSVSPLRARADSFMSSCGFFDKTVSKLSDCCFCWHFFSFHVVAVNFWFLWLLMMFNRILFRSGTSSPTKVVEIPLLLPPFFPFEKWKILSFCSVLIPILPHWNANPYPSELKH